MYARSICLLIVVGRRLFFFRPLDGTAGRHRLSDQQPRDKNHDVNGLGTNKRRTIGGRVNYILINTYCRYFSYHFTIITLKLYKAPPPERRHGRQRDIDAIEKNYDGKLSECM